jgi:hypothetical protein
MLYQICGEISLKSALQVFDVMFGSLVVFHLIGSKGFANYRA